MSVGYYVDIVRGSRVGLLAGPYPTHQAALDKVTETSRRAADIDPFTHFDQIGTMRLERDELPASVFGVL